MSTVNTAQPAQDDDDDVSGMWRAFKEAKQQKRADNRQSSAEVLTREGIHFERKNDGAHLIVKHEDKVIDFWPGTGLWLVRGEKKRNGGVFNLIKFLNGARTTGARDE